MLTGTKNLNSTCISALSRDFERNHEAPAGMLRSLSLSVRLRAKRGRLGGTSSGLPGISTHMLAHVLTCILVVVSGGTVNDINGKMPTKRAKYLPRCALKAFGLVSSKESEESAVQYYRPCSKRCMACRCLGSARHCRSRPAQDQRRVVSVVVYLVRSLGTSVWNSGNEIRS
jgi:hypothetical protein